MSDIDKLIAAADKDQQTKKQKARLRKSENGLGLTRKASKLWWIALVVILAVALFNLAPHFLPVSEDVARSELSAALDAAQSSVEWYLRVNGQLPDRVPAIALAGMVQYELVGDGYRLSATMNGVTLSRDQFGAQAGTDD